MSLPTSLDTDNTSSDDLKAILEHVFLPPQLPQKDAGDPANHRHDILLCRLVHAAAEKYTSLLPLEQRAFWTSICRMYQRMQDFTSARDKKHIVANILSMQTGGETRKPLPCAT